MMNKYDKFLEIRLNVLDFASKPASCGSGFARARFSTTMQLRFTAPLPLCTNKEGTGRNNEEAEMLKTYL